MSTSSSQRGMTPDSHNASRYSALAAALVALVLVAPAASLGGVSTSSTGSFRAGTKFVSPSGSNRNPGTKAAPWRTIRKAISAARPGNTIVLRAGTYGGRGRTTTVDTSGTRSAPIRFRGYPGEPRPSILGYFKITGHDLRFARLRFRGPTGRVKPITTDNPKGEQVEVAIRGGDRVWIIGSEIRDSSWHAGIYIIRAHQVHILRNNIHDNGDDGPCCYRYQKNSSHGIYFNSGSGVIANNVIHHNLARGVQLHPRPHDVVVKENTIVFNRQAGVQVSKYAANNTIANNIVAFNVNYSIRSYRLTGTGNRGLRNLVWGGAHPLGTLAAGLSLSGSIQAPPRFVSGSDYHLQSVSPAVDGANPNFTVSQDFDGIPRPQGAAFDIGAFEAP
jgi:parallel beta helix pectate lyase-like protein/uncharacterized protein DUF1565